MEFCKYFRDLKYMQHVLMNKFRSNSFGRYIIPLKQQSSHIYENVFPQFMSVK